MCDLAGGETLRLAVVAQHGEKSYIKVNHIVMYHVVVFTVGTGCD